jgi:hypothetical protein
MRLKRDSRLLPVGETVGRLVDTACQPEARVRSKERVAAVDQDRRRPDEPKPLRLLGRVDPLEGRLDA